MDSLASMFGSGSSTAAMPASEAVSAGGMSPSDWSGSAAGVGGGGEASTAMPPSTNWNDVLQKSIFYGRALQGRGGQTIGAPAQTPMMSPFQGGVQSGGGLDPQSAMLLQQLMAGTAARRAAGAGTQPMMAFAGQPNAFGQLW